jgi:hypothetical protein
MRKLLLIFIIPILSTSCVLAQRWKSLRYEMCYGLGATNFLGDLGGSSQLGTHYFRDLNWNETGLAVHAGLRYRMTDYTSLKANLFIANVSGDDKNSSETFRHNRNLSFYTNIIELSGQFEFSYMKEKLGHRYKLKGIKGNSKLDIYNYFFIGLGMFYFNPQAKLDGTWYDLQPLGTEGQGILPTRDRYSRIQVAIPLGFGLKKALGGRWAVNLEYGIRKTFTDYIDDVSTTYVDPKIFPAGSPAALLSNRALAGKDPADPMYGSSAPNQQRGDPRFTDSYMFAVVSVTYKLKNGKGNLPKF